MISSTGTGLQRKFLAALSIVVMALTACGDLGAINQAATLRQLEALEGPPRFERLGIELVDEDTGLQLHRGGYVVNWQARGETPQEVMDAFVPVLRDVGYLTEPFDGTICTDDRLRLFLVFEPNFLGSARLFYDEADNVVQLLAGWDPRGDSFTNPVLDVLPNCGPAQ